MPAKRYDYDLAEILHAKGMQIKEIHEQTKIPYESLQKHALRHGWTKKRQKAVQLVCGNVQQQISEAAAKHLLDMSSLAARAITVLGSKPLETLHLDDLQTLASIANTFDQIGRRTHGLDNQEGKITLNMAVQVSPPSTTKPLGAIIDVEPENGAAQAQVTDGK